MEYDRTKTYFFVGGIFLLNLFLKILYLDFRDIAMDEPFTIYFAQGALPDLYQMLKTENNPPLFFLILHFWIRIFGISPFAVRFLPMIFSCLTACIIFLTGKRYWSLRTGIVAALLFTFSNYHMLFAHETRVYSLFALLTALSFYFFIGLVHSFDNKKAFVLLISNVLLVYSHFFGFLVIFIQFISCLLLRDLRRVLLKKYLFLILAILVFYLPYFFIFLQRFIISTTGGTWVPKPVIADLYNQIWKFSNAPVSAVFLLLILISGFLVFLFRKWRDTSHRPRTETFILLIWFFVPYLGMFLASFFIPMFLDRYLVYISVGFYLLVAITLNELSVTRIVGIILPFAAIMVMAVTFRPDMDNKRRWKEVVSQINALRNGQVPLVICPSWLQYGFSYHFDQSTFRNKDLPKVLNKMNIYPVSCLTELDTSVMLSSDRVVLFSEWIELIDPDHQIHSFLNEHFPRNEVKKVYESFSITCYYK